MSAASVPSGLTTEEHSNDASMLKQFTRFDAMAIEVKKRVTQLEPAAMQQVPTVDVAALAPVLQSSYLHLLELKAISRALTNLAEQTKAQMQARKKRLDVVNLQYESILYEQAHFQKEIAIAKDFKSKYESITLVSEADFRAGTGSGGSGVPPAVPADCTAHELHLLRLHDELERRSRLQQQQTEAEAGNAEQQSKNDVLKAKDNKFLAQMQAAEEANRQLANELWPGDRAFDSSDPAFGKE